MICGMVNADEGPPAKCPRLIDTAPAARLAPVEESNGGGFLGLLKQADESAAQQTSQISVQSQAVEEDADEVHVLQIAQTCGFTETKESRRPVDHLQSGGGRAVFRRNCKPTGWSIWRRVAWEIFRSCQK